MNSGKPVIIALTGGIGSGKSTASAYLSEKGCPVIDADKIAREIVAPGMPALDKLAALFGQGVLNGDGSLNRKRLAGIVFADDSAKKRMESVMHGEILSIMKERAGKLADSGERLIVLDFPLLFETGGFAGETDEIWLIDADDELRVERVMRRDGSTRAEVQSRVNSQMSRAEKRKRARVIIDNSGSMEELYQKLDRLIEAYE
jgi:dephospho-CoA kinase